MNKDFVNVKLSTLREGSKKKEVNKITEIKRLPLYVSYPLLNWVQKIFNENEICLNPIDRNKSITIICFVSIIQLGSESFHWKWNLSEPNRVMDTKHIMVIDLLQF